MHLQIAAVSSLASKKSLTAIKPLSFPSIGFHPRRRIEHGQAV